MITCKIFAVTSMEGLWVLYMSLVSKLYKICICFMFVSIRVLSCWCWRVWISVVCLQILNASYSMNCGFIKTFQQKKMEGSFFDLNLVLEATPVIASCGSILTDVLVLILCKSLMPMPMDAKQLQNNPPPRSQIFLCVSY